MAPRWGRNGTERWLTKEDNGTRERLYAYVICCFSEKRDNILMWAHYAKQHTGFCLEFNVDNDFFTPSTRAIKVEYNAIWPELNVMRLDSCPEGELGKKVIIKANNWEYEQEWRILDYGHFWIEYK